MDGSPLLFEVRDGVAFISLNRPDLLNTLNLVQRSSAPTRKNLGFVTGAKPGEE
jgi:hypothetical protein